MKSFADLARRRFRRATKSQMDSARNKAKLAVTLLEDRTVPATVEGTIFYDGNGDGAQDGGENYAVGIGVLLSGADGSSQTGTTDSLGHYVFSDVSPGSYTVIVTGAPTGYTAQVANGSANPIGVVSDTDDIGVGFGLEGGAGGGGGSGSGSGSGGTDTFTLGGVEGSITYTMPWDSIDSTLASQAIDLTDFQISVGGQLFTSSRSDITFSQSPQVTLSNGVVTGINFATDTSGVVGYQYSSVSMSGFTLTATAPGQDPVQALVADQPQAVIWFNQTTSDTKDTQISGVATIRIKFKLTSPDGSVSTYEYNAAPSEGQTIGDTVSIVLADMKKGGRPVTATDSGRGIILTGGAGTTKVGIYYDGATATQPIKPNLKGGVGLLTYSDGKWSE
ncbi:MAG TPA: SdrD B-like domain-containing protein [Urbifossiella sp.]|nr:SdrD B-like domain-containing protein [Urbifossiella sp.]